jgi:hypothetical protein
MPETKTQSPALTTAEAGTELRPANLARAGTVGVEISIMRRSRKVNVPNLENPS